MSFITGVGLTSYGKHEGSSSLDLMSKAAELAIADAGLKRSEIDGILCGYSTVSPHIMLATVFAEHFGIQPSYAHAVQVGGATGLAMTMLAHHLVEAGVVKHVLVVGGENRLTGQSRDASIQALNWQFRSGDRLQVTVSPAGDRPVQPFEISPGTVIAPGPYQWLRRTLGVTTAQKRRFYTSFNWTTGSFYDGELDQYEGSWVWNPTPLFTVEFNGERNVGDLPAGEFSQSLVGTRLRMNFSPDLSIASYAQYDTDSDSIGVNTRLRWTLLPVAELFVVYNHNVRSLLDRWQLESNQLLIKLQYTWRM
jgi:hypothetical protein